MTSPAMGCQPLLQSPIMTLTSEMPVKWAQMTSPASIGFTDAVSSRNIFLKSYVFYKSTISRLLHTSNWFFMFLFLSSTRIVRHEVVGLQILQLVPDRFYCFGFIFCGGQDIISAKTFWGISHLSLSTEYFYCICLLTALLLWIGDDWLINY